jgi:hypothetical protein
LRCAAAVLVVLALLTAAAPVASAWAALRSFRGDRAYLLYEVSYVVRVVGRAASGEARASYLLHILIERLNTTHYVVSALADNVTYSFTSDDPVFLHVLANLFLVNMSRQFVELLYIPPVEGVTLRVTVEGSRVAQLLNALTRWYNIVEDTTGERCSEVSVGNVTVASGIRYRIPTLGAELVYDCPSGLLVSLRAQLSGSYGDLRTEVRIGVELSKTNVLELTSIKPPAVAGGPPPGGTATLVLALAAVAVASAAVAVLVALRRVRG